MWRHIVGEPYVTAHHSMMPYAHAAKYRRVGIHRNIVLEDGVSGFIDRQPMLIVGEIFGSQGNALIEHHMVAYHTCGSYHHTGAVVDAEILAYLRRRVNVDAGG